MKRVAAWISNACAAIADALLELAILLEGPRKPPRRVPITDIVERAKPEPAKAKMPLPTPDMLDQARGVAAVNDWSVLRVCRGSAWGCDGRDDQHACSDCYGVRWYDKRPSAEILEAIKRGDA